MVANNKKKVDLFDPVCRAWYKDRIDESILAMRPFKAKRLKYIEDYVGNDYGTTQHGDEDMQFLGMIRQMVSIYTAELASGNPECRVGARYPENEEFARYIEANINNLADLIELRGTLYEWVLESMFGLAVMKLGVGSADWIQSDANIYSLAELPFSDVVSLDDWFGDMQAKKLSTMRFVGNDYLVNEEDLLNSELYDQKTVAKWIERLGERGHLYKGSQDEASDLSRDSKYSSDLGYRQFCVRDIWIPSQGKLYTIDRDMEFEPLAVIDYSDRPKGPYRYLVHQIVPGNIMPVAPVDGLYEFSRLVNNCYRKLAEQARAQKNLNLFGEGDEEVATTAKNAKNNEWVRVPPDTVKPYSIPGADQGLFSYTLSAIQLGEKQGGNYPSIGGLGAQTDTVGQEQIIHSSLSGMVDRMRTNVLNATSDIYEGLTYEIWPDDVGFRSTIDLGEVGLPDETVERNWEPGNRVGDPSQYTYTVEPNSMKYQSPQAQVSSAMQMISEVFMPLTQTPDGQAQRMSVSTKDVVKFVADKLNQPWWYSMIQFNGQSIVSPAEVDKTTPKPKMGGEKVYTHRSDGGKPADPMAEIMAGWSKSNADNNPQMQ